MVIDTKYQNLPQDNTKSIMARPALKQRGMRRTFGTSHEQWINFKNSNRTTLREFLPSCTVYILYSDNAGGIGIMVKRAHFACSHQANCYTLYIWTVGVQLGGSPHIWEAPPISTKSMDSVWGVPANYLYYSSLYGGTPQVKT